MRFSCGKNCIIIRTDGYRCRELIKITSILHNTIILIILRRRNDDTDGVIVFVRGRQENKCRLMFRRELNELKIFIVCATFCFCILYTLKEQSPPSELKLSQVVFFSLPNTFVGLTVYVPI